MSAHNKRTEIIIAQAQKNHDLAVEIFCELYIHSHYTEEQVGIDGKAVNYEIHSASSNSWLSDLLYRLNSIFRRRGVSITVDMNDVADLFEHESALGISLQEVL